MNNTQKTAMNNTAFYSPSARRDFRRSLVTVTVIGACAVAAGIGALAVLHVGITARTVALCAAPLVAGVVAFLTLAPIEQHRRAGR